MSTTETEKTEAPITVDDAVKILYALQRDGHGSGAREIDRVIKLLLTERGAIVPPFLVETVDRDKANSERWHSELMSDVVASDTKLLSEHLGTVIARVSVVAEYLHVAGRHGEELSQATLLHLANTLAEVAGALCSADECIWRWGTWGEEARAHAVAAPLSGADTKVATAIKEHRKAEAASANAAALKGRKDSRRYLMTMIKQQAAADAKAGRSPAAKARRPRAAKRKAVR